MNGQYPVDSQSLICAIGRSISFQDTQAAAYDTAIPTVTDAGNNSKRSYPLECAATLAITLPAPRAIGKCQT